MAAAAGGGCCGVLYSFLFEYDTPRIVLIKSRKVGLMNRLVQLAILAYVIGWVFVWEKGYQETDSVVSSVTTKVKGLAVTNTSELGLRIWDVADYVIPPQGENAVFIMTNLIITLNQTQSSCPELPDKTTTCSSDSDCTAGYIGTHSNGIQTGKCSSAEARSKTCEIFGWCPVEDVTKLYPTLLSSRMLKTSPFWSRITFGIPSSTSRSMYASLKRNILPTINSTYLKSCKYHPQTDRFCPIFRLRTMTDAAGQDFQEMAVQGGVMGLQINWDCDLDKPYSRCVPKYSFRRIDNKDSSHTVSPGYNFRFAKYYQTAEGVDSRTLIKAYGIRFDIMVFGQAGKFNIIPTMINIGSGLALFGVATVLCDIIVLYFMKKRYYYREKKYKYVEDYELGNSTSYGSQEESPQDRDVR
uniref:P2X purinoceptor 4 n=1 Tax=Sphaerodactylus townsendi TaxID=933632 RepID=A0ACB8FZR6_9SAUR